MNWELFVDESGDFEAGKRCLVGGFLLPEGAVTPEGVRAWKDDIRRAPEVRQCLDDFGEWNYDHCCENRTSGKAMRRARTALQLSILREYTARFEALGGRLILFDNPDGAFNTDNTTNFLSVLAKGLMQLFFRLKEEGLDALRVHFASRRNNTYYGMDDEPNAQAVSPTAGTSGVILKAQYINQIRNLAFLQGGQTLLDDGVFEAMLSDIDILEDRMERDRNGRKRFYPNDMTVPCDYICNTYFRIADEPVELENYPKALWIFDVTRPLVTPSDGDGLKWIRGGDNSPLLLRLMSRNFPDPFASAFWRAFNGQPRSVQLNLVETAVGAVKPYVEKQYRMKDWITRLENCVEEAENIADGGVRGRLKCNMLLFEHSLYTHLGQRDRVEAVKVAFLDDLGAVEDADEREALLSLFFNRRIVDSTDGFDYEQGERTFRLLRAYWEGRIQLSESCFEPLGLGACRFSEYAKENGSYLQSLRNRMHLSRDPEKKAALRETALECGNVALKHFAQDADRARVHQTLGDIASEVGEFDEALSQLTRAAELLTGETGGLELILKSAGEDGAGNPYMLQHYTRLMAAMFEADPNDARAEAMYAAMKPMIGKNMCATVSAVQPRALILYRTASTLALRAASDEQERRTAKRLLSAAEDILCADGSASAMFAAVAVAVCAERLRHVRHGRIDHDEAFALKALKQRYDGFKACKPEIDPFKEAFEGELTEEKLCEMLRVIGW